jgi:hypothetical protein
MTSPKMLLRYPWTSVDSSRYAQLAFNGMIIVPRNRSGRPDYTLQPFVIAVTDRMRYNGMKHLDTINEFELECVRTFLTEEVGGVDVAQVRGAVKYRWRVALTYFTKLEMCCRQRHDSQFTIAHVTDTGMWKVFDQCDVQHRLISYARLMHQADDRLAKLIPSVKATPKAKRL